MDDRRIYVIIPRNLDVDGKKFTMTCGRMAAHAAHVSGILARASGENIADIDLIVLSCANSGELFQVKDFCISFSVLFVEYLDTDKCFDGEVLTAIATYPLSRDMAQNFKLLRPWKCECNDSPVAQRRALDSNQGVVAANTASAERQSGSTPTRGANF